ncbi:MAG TPA: glycosyltransferase family 4 protein [Acidobacteriaceae bacterium]
MANLQLKKAARILSQRGLKQGLRGALTAWARSFLSTPPNVIGAYDFILLPEKKEELPPPDNGPLRINWLVPQVRPGAGGLFNIFRTIYYLEQWGHENRIYMIGDDSSNGVATTRLVKDSYFPIKGNVEVFGGEIADSDALVSTSWMTSYIGRSIGNTARKYYFVQDLEHMFYPHGSLHEFARTTYSWGFYGLTAGKWISDVLSEEYGMRCTSFGFSYDRDTYSSVGPRSLPAGKKRVLAYVRPSTERRGYELTILALKLVAVQIPEIEFVLVGYLARPAILPFNTVTPGILSVSELAQLYRSCDVALVLSHTNLSLLPLELMACGCPVVSNRGPNVEWQLSNENAYLADPNPESISAAIIDLLQNDELREKKRADALRFSATTDWIREIKAIEVGLLKGLGLSKKEVHG